MDAKVAGGGTRKPSEEEMLVTASGARHAIARYGLPGGLPVLAFHGAPASRFMFDVADAPARDLGLELICPDRPGYGLTPADRSPTLQSRTDRHVELVEALGEALGLRHFHILGISGGGPYAVALAARMPSRVRGLALVSPIGPVAEATPPTRNTMHPFQRWFFTRLPARRRLLRIQGRIAAAAFKAAPVSFARMFARTLGPADRAVLSQRHVEASLIRMTQEALRQGPGGGIADLEIFSRPWEVDYRGVTCPAVLWQGTADRIVPPAVSLALADRLADCTAVRLPLQGHFWVYDHAREVLARLKSLA